jgi:hypothetical protein
MIEALPLKEFYDLHSAVSSPRRLSREGLTNSNTAVFSKTAVEERKILELAL